MNEERICRARSCRDAAVAALEEQNLCLSHFVEQCYGQLNRLDPRGQKTPSEICDLAQTRAFVEECSRETLEVCLRSANLSNLERGRLLDILLWAGELFLLLRAPRLTFTDTLNNSGGSSMLTRAASLL